MKKLVRVRDIMKKEFKVVERKETLWDAATQMVEYNIGCLIVNPKEKSEPFGIITRRDIVNVFAEELDLKTTIVDEVANAPLVIVSPGMPVLHAAKIMKRMGLKHLAVFNGQEIVGVLSTTDIIKAIIEK